jgi:hypothetical protein
MNWNMLLSVTAGCTTNNSSAADSLGGQELGVEVSQWVDANNDGALTDNELTLVGSGTHTYTSNAERGKFFEIPVYDATTGSPSVFIGSNSVYLIVATYAGSRTVFINAMSGDRDYARNYADSTDQDLYLPLLSSGWGRFANVSIQPALAANFEIGLEAIKPAAAGILRLYPNPATKNVFVLVDGSSASGPANIRLRDLSGRIVTEQQATITSGSAQVRVGLEGITPGLYSVEVSTAKGLLTKRIVVQ